MSDFLAARAQMAMSLAFHIIFAAVGIGMPLLMVIAEGLWLRTREETYLVLAKRWAKGTAILFAVGAVSGTVLSFELGLLWPGFMRFAGPIIGMPFSLEGFAFFTEAIFLGIYLYGWKRVSPRIHLLAGVLTAISGAISGVLAVVLQVKFFTYHWAAMVGLLVLAVTALARDLAIDAAAITFVSAAAVEWNDSSLGCPKPGLSYLQVITPGYRMVFEAQGRTYEYHTDMGKRVVRCDG